MVLKMVLEVSDKAYEFDDNYCRGGDHKSLFEDSSSECGGGAATMRYGLISK